MMKKKLVWTVITMMIATASWAQTNSKTYTVGGVSFKMIKVEGGTFQMGATSDQGEYTEDDEKPVHNVTLSDYSIGETEVTQALWQAVMGNLPEGISSEDYDIKGPQRPVCCVSWVDCQEFIRKLNAKTGQKFRLPTEAEWEYAARGGKKSKGYLYAGSNRIEEVAYKNMEERIPMPVAQFKPNELGLYDMSGNVWEWCEDWYRKTPTSKPSSNFHVIRGGGYDCSPRYCRSTNRYMYDKRRRRDLVGFRLAL
jgi:formylglycine-generating enzyme required for sulfatase activity